MIAAHERTESRERVGRRMIILGIDDSAEAGAAAHWAVREAELRKDEDTRLNLAEILAGWKADNPDIDVDTLLLAGAPRDTVDSVSADVQLLVVGSPYRGREWARWIRSVARAVLDRATCPVAVVPPQHPRSAMADKGWGFLRSVHTSSLADGCDGRHLYGFLNEAARTTGRRPTKRESRALSSMRVGASSCCCHESGGGSWLATYGSMRI